MKANELRIGNIVRIKDYVLCVKAISDTLTLGNNNISDFVHDSFDYSDVSPIILTPEILEKCGFENNDEDGVLTFTLEVSKTNIADHGNNEYQLFGIRSKNDSIQINYTVNRYWAARPIHYLHQLQNIYFALTGEDLEIKSLVTAD